MTKSILLLIISGISLVIFIGLTNPNNLGVGFLFLPILLLFVFFSSLINLLIAFLSKKTEKQKRLSASLFMGLILAMSFLFYSSSGVVAGDLIILALVFVIGVIYINKY
jgi:hypothetical protein